MGNSNFPFTTNPLCEYLIKMNLKKTWYEIYKEQKSNPTYLNRTDTMKKTLGAKIISFMPILRLFNAICVSFPVP